jgi:hypothetical protein
MPEFLQKHDVPKAKDYAKKLRNCGLSYSQIAGRLGRGITWCQVRGWLRPSTALPLNEALLKLPEFPAALREESLLLWAAGFFDGEGSVMFINGKPHVISVVNTNLESLKRFKNAVGGVGSIKPQKTPPQNKPVWRWTAHGISAEQALLKLLPSLLIKFPAARLYLIGRTKIRRNHSHRK